MKVVGRELLEDFAQGHADIRSQLDAWFAEAEASSWDKPSDIKQRYANASILPQNRVVFNLKGNKYRLVTKVSYKLKVVSIEWVGTHADYDKLEL